MANERPDPMGFRVIRDRWQKVGAIDVPIPDEAARRAQLEAFAENLGRMLQDPEMRLRLEREHEWRLEQLIRWTVRRPW